MSGICERRVTAEHKAWRKDHPYAFWARPKKEDDGSKNMRVWEVGVQGKENTSWEGGVYTLTMTFPDDYPAKPPICKFPINFWHPNVYPSGTVCLSILNEEKNWEPAITVKQILLGIQELLDSPNPDDPAQTEAYLAYKVDKGLYDKKVRDQARIFAPC